MFEIGDRVLTRRCEGTAIGWTAEAYALRRWGVEGMVVNTHDSHGKVFAVQHDSDGSTGYYEAKELIRSVLLEIGTRVRTVEPSEVRVNWSKSVVARRRWGAEGVICIVHEAKSTNPIANRMGVYEVKHDEDGSFGFYDSSELVAIEVKLDLKGYREERVQDLLEDWTRDCGCHEPKSKAEVESMQELLEKAFDAAVDRVKQQYINQYEKLIKALRKEVEHDTPTGEYSEVRALLSDFKVKWEKGFDGWQDGAEIEYRCAMRAAPHDLREAGWVVAVHNDYKIDGKPMTFWLVTKQVSGSPFPLCLKGEGATDLEALDQIRQHAFAKEEVADGTSSEQVSGAQTRDQFSGGILRNE